MSTGKHPKQEFQVERLAFFSDAIFAVAITLLVIDFKVPHVTKTTTLAEVRLELNDLVYNLVSLLISFALIASYWIRHHFLFKHIHNYNRPIIIANMLVLLPIIFFPFTSAFMAESLENREVGLLSLQFFLLNNVLAGFTMYYLYWIAIERDKEHAYQLKQVEKIKFKSDLLFPTTVFALILLLTLLSPGRANVHVIFSVMLICFIIKTWLEKKRMKKSVSGY